MRPNLLFLAALVYVAVAVPIGNVQDVVHIEARGPPPNGPRHENVGAAPKPSPKGHHTQVTIDKPRTAPYGSPGRIKGREIDWDDIEA